MIDVWTNKRYVHINREALKGNARDSEMYVQVQIVQREYIAGRLPLHTKKVEQKVGHRVWDQWANKSKMTAIDHGLS